MIEYCFVIQEYNPVKEKQELRVLALHKDNITPCDANPRPIEYLKRVYKIVSGDTPLSRYYAEEFIKNSTL